MRQRVVAPTLAALLSLCVFLPGITWGLPSRDVDSFLFGDREPWTGEEIVRLTGEFDVGDGSADADTVEADDGEWLNDTDRERAEIVTRYRLYSYQPDEMLTFRALATAAANRGDPQFYTYGGLWVYPVGVLVKASQLVGLIGEGGQAYYLDHPEEFAKFYIVARLYAVAWAAAGAAIICVLVRRVTRSAALGVIAAVTYALLPVVVVAAHEAKPHLPGAVLALWAVLPAEMFVRTGRRRSLLWSGLLCGLAAGMVVTMAVSFLVLPTAIVLRWNRHRSRLRGYLLPLTTSVALGCLAFAITNPYLVLNLLTNPAAVAGNAGQTAGHYSLSVEGFGNAARVLGQAAAWPVGVVGLVCMVLPLVVPWCRKSVGRPFRLLLALLIGPALLAGLSFFLTADNRPADHARFALLLVLTLAVSLMVVPVLVHRKTRFPGWVAVVPLLLTASHFSDRPADSFRIDLSRFKAAGEIVIKRGGGDMTLWADPAPAFVPPFNLWAHRVKVVAPAEADVRMTAGSMASISWADRLFVIESDKKTPDDQQ